MICEIFWSYKTELSNSNNEKEERKQNQNKKSFVGSYNIGIFV